MTILRTPADPTRPRGRRRHAADLHSTPRRTGGTPRRSTAATRTTSSGRDPASTASCGSTPTACRPSTSIPLSPKHPADVPGFWLGLAMLHTLFTLEHNAICDRLRAEYPTWSDDELFEHARLVNAALLAKIHTVEWTPAIIDHPTTVRALRGDWWGLAGERLHRLFGRFSDSEIISGIVGSHDGPLRRAVCADGGVRRRLPHAPADAGRLRLPRRRRPPLLLERDFERRGPAARRWRCWARCRLTRPLLLLRRRPPRARSRCTTSRAGCRNSSGRMGDCRIWRRRTSCARASSGCRATTHSAKLLHLPPVTTFEELTDNPRWAEELRQVYDGDIDRVDLMVGMFAEPKPRRLRVQRHGVSHLRPDGPAAAEQRPLLHDRLHASGLHPDRARLDRRQHHSARLSCATSRLFAPPADRHECVPPLVTGRLKVAPARDCEAMDNGESPGERPCASRHRLADRARIALGVIRLDQWRSRPPGVPASWCVVWASDPRPARPRSTHSACSACAPSCLPPSSCSPGSAARSCPPHRGHRSRRRHDRRGVGRLAARTSPADCNGHGGYLIDQHSARCPRPPEEHSAQRHHASRPANDASP